LIYLTGINEPVVFKQQNVAKKQHFLPVNQWLTQNVLFGYNTSIVNKKE